MALPGGIVGRSHLAWRALASVAGAGLLVWATSCPAGANDRSSKTIRIIVPVAAGSSLDARARVIAQALGQRLGQQPIVENKPGAGGTIGSAYVAKSAPDGSVLLFTNDALVINPHVYRDPGYDALKDFAPITQAYVSSMVLIESRTAKPQTVQDLVALARDRPGTLTYGSSGNGGLPHLAMEVFNRMAGLSLVHVPYKGDSQALTDLLAGRISIMVSGIPAALGYIRSGDMRALAVTGAQRVRALPNVPTVAEAGLPGFDVFAWTGFFAPTGTPAQLVDQLNRDLVASLSSEAVRAHLEATGGQPATSSPTEFSLLVRQEFERYGKLVKAIGLKLD
ncbi:MAG: tripartite tricarboxylate transporter substrate binding protein [Betaproteobacteria bacterium]